MGEDATKHAEESEMRYCYVQMTSFFLGSQKSKRLFSHPMNNTVNIDVRSTEKVRMVLVQVKNSGASADESSFFVPPKMVNELPYSLANPFLFHVSDRHPDWSACMSEY